MLEFHWQKLIFLPARGSEVLQRHHEHLIKLNNIHIKINILNGTLKRRFNFHRKKKHSQWKWRAHRLSEITSQ